MSSAKISTGPGEGDVTGPDAGAGVVLVRYWAAARAARGVAEERVEVPAEGVTISELLAGVTERGTPRLAAVVAICSVLLDETAVHGPDVRVALARPGSVVDLLPPFAGG
ncbi:MoaD/ThiS family protein [Nocardioidaceae bacterium]|nr:MoaD/ThiS family protein [Nocardioidaceae bacterium]